MGLPGVLAAVSVTRALRDSRPARERLERIYGFVPPVVYLVQREGAWDGPVKVAYAQRLAQGLADPDSTLYGGAVEKLNVLAAVPGGQALRHWFQVRHRGEAVAGEWFDRSVVEDARAFGETHAVLFAHLKDMGMATVVTLRAMDVFLKDFERMYLNGVSYAEISGLAGMGVVQVRKQVERMRALGFTMPHRQPYRRRPVKLDLHG